MLPILNRNFTSFELLVARHAEDGGMEPRRHRESRRAANKFSSTASTSAAQRSSWTELTTRTRSWESLLSIRTWTPFKKAKVTLGNYDAEFGKAVAGVVTVQTKSGSNDIHGSGFWFRRTDATAARDPFTQYQPDAVTGQFDSFLALAAVRRQRWAGQS